MRWLNRYRARKVLIERADQLQSQLKRQSGSLPKSEDNRNVIAESSEEMIVALRQLPLELEANDRGILIPDSLFNQKGTLTFEGEAWLRAEVIKSKRSNIEFWAKIILPVLSLIVSIIALLVAMDRTR